MGGGADGAAPPYGERFVVPRASGERTGGRLRHGWEVAAPTVDEVLGFAREHKLAVLATHRGDGGVQMSPVMVGVDDGTLVISSRETASKTHNLRRDPRGWVCLITRGFFGAWHQAEGRVTIESLPEAMDALVRYYRAVSGEHPDWEDYRAAMLREQRVILRMTIDRVGPTRQG